MLLDVLGCLPGPSYSRPKNYETRELNALLDILTRGGLVRLLSMSQWSLGFTGADLGVSWACTFC